MRVNGYIRSVRILLFACAFSPALGLGQTAKGPVDTIPDFTGNPGAGRRILLEKQCLRCHSVLGKGSLNAPDLAKIGGSHTYFQLVGLMWGHSPRMIDTLRKSGMKWPQFTSQQMEDMIAYLHSLGGLQENGDPLKGERLFAERSCVRCHRVGEAKDGVGPRLDSLGRHPSGVRMAMAMWNHGPAMSGVMQIKGITRPALDEDDVAQILAFIRARSRDGGSVEYSPMGDPAAGWKVLKSSGCTTCHGPQGRGDVGPDLAGAGARSVALIASKLWNHAPAMIQAMQRASIQVPVLDVRQTGDLMALLGFLGYVDTAGNLAHGRQLYEQKGCVQCHGHPGKGDGKFPDLANMEALRTRSGIASALWNHAPSMVEAMASEGNQVAWPRFVDDEMRDLIEYVSTAGQAAAPTTTAPATAAPASPAKATVPKPEAHPTHAAPSKSAPAAKGH
ncbi:MAG: c-type cytochrome [Candidatus Wallbacteria bacterium]|nr:c-type cytochrome [Candidatus Wallbacteria bacterium]